jgi:3-oxoacyl-[acyl-carrier-protein] synthase II
MGLLSPIGQEPTAYFAALQAGQTGIRRIRCVDPSPLACQVGGEIDAFDARKHLEKRAHKSLRTMAKAVQMGVAASERALVDAGVCGDRYQLDPPRFGIEFGAGMIATELDDLGMAASISTNCQPGSVSLTTWGEKGLGEIPPLWMLKYLPNMPACHTSILHNAQGPNNTITESDVASLLAVGEAYKTLLRNRADFMLVGGTESKLNPLSLSRNSLFMPLSQRADASACRPFDRHRDGTVLGEASGVLALEDLAHAQKRGAKIYAEVVGFGAAFDRRRDGAGVARAIRAALVSAQVTPDQVDHINAHGLGAVQADIAEAKGLAEVFGAAQPSVWALKATFGNTGAAAGTTELAASVLALQHGELPRTLNYETPDPACPVNVNTANRPIRKPYAVKVSFTDMGQCAAVVVKQWK